MKSEKVGDYLLFPSFHGIDLGALWAESDVSGWKIHFAVDYTSSCKKLSEGESAVILCAAHPDHDHVFYFGLMTLANDVGVLHVLEKWCIPEDMSKQISDIESLTQILHQWGCSPDGFGCWLMFFIGGTSAAMSEIWEKKECTA